MSEDDIATDPRRVRMVDVARRAGVSRTTASFVLSGRTDMRIATETKQRVMRAALELQYRPSLLAQGLNTSSSKSVGLIWDAADGAFSAGMTRGALSEGALHDHGIVLGECTNDPRRDELLAQSMVERGVTGFIYASSEARRVSVPPAFQEHPLVLLNGVAAGSGHMSVLPDERAAGREMTQLLLQAGHAGTMVVVGEVRATFLAATERLAGIREGLKAANLPMCSTLPCRWQVVAAQEAVRTWLTERAEQSAFICLNERIAVGAYRALHEAGQTIARDASVVGFEESGLSTFSRPALTSAAMPHFEMGRQAVRLLLSPSAVAGVRRVPMPLTIRDSARPLART